MMHIPTGFNPTMEIQKKMKESYEIFQSNAFEGFSLPKAYKLHEAMYNHKSCNTYCLGCAISESILLISNYVKKHALLNEIEIHTTEYLFILNLLADRMETILFMVNIDEEYRKNEFAVFQELKEWSYFLKPYTTCITPQKTCFVFENNISKVNTTMFSHVLDKHFVKDYFKTKGKCGEWVKDQYVVLILPDVSVLTRQICQALDSFLALLLSQKAYLNQVH
jgi:hypothetical protein